MRPPSRDDFEVAIICALPREADAVRAVFDEVFSDSSYGKAQGDTNSYTTGRIGQHHVVLAHMPEMGKGSAATVTSSLKVSYLGLKLVLLVGVCGAVPFTASNTEIILGDVIISNGILRYDFGRQYPTGFERKQLRETLCEPTREIRSVLAKLETREARRQFEDQLARYLGQAQRSLGDKAQYPSAITDRLFEASYSHKHTHRDPDATCACLQSTSVRAPVCSRALEEDCATIGCDGRLVPRTRLSSKNPKAMVHIGKVASGDIIMKSGVDRDEVAHKEKVIAFEMEAAGVWDTLPCLVIKGVCDYADSHKDKAWQDYAASMAGAAAKAFLEYWVPASTSKRAQRWMVPFQQNEVFTGRENELDRLERGLYVDRFSKMAIHGLGGMGKSSVALEFAHRSKTKHPNHLILWVYGANPETFEQSYRQIAERLGLPIDEKTDVLSLLKSYLSDESAGRWLMILDNADDMAVWYDPRGPRLADHIPTSALGSVLLTTRTRQIAIKFAARGLVGLAEMDFEKSSELLRNALVDAELCDTDKTQELLEKLCFLPLAITQAAAYINMNLASFDDYLTLLSDTEQNQTMVETLSEEFEDDGRYQDQQNPVITTWLVSFEQIRRDKPWAAKYISMMSRIEPKAVPLSFLPAPSTKQKLEAIATLASYSFISKRMDGSLDMHRLVHLATRNWLVTNGELKECLGTVMTQLAAIYPDLDDEHRTEWRPLLPHVSFALKLNTEWDETVDDLLHAYGVCLLSDGRYFDAEWPFEQALGGGTKARGAEHPNTLAIMGYLASTYRNQGLWTKAENLELEVIETRKKVLGAEHPDTLASMSNQALTYTNQGRWAEAEELGLEVLEIERRVLDSQHSDTLISMLNLALVYSNQGRWVEAEKLGLEVMETRKKLHGPEHPETLRSIANLASTYTDMGRWAEAEKLEIEVLETRQRVLGHEHPDTFVSLNNLGHTYWSQGRWTEAEKLQYEGLQISLKVLGDKHPETLRAMGNLASTYKNQDRLQKAEELEVKVLGLRRELLDEDHPDVLRSIANLSSTYAAQGRWSEAKKLDIKALEARRRVLGPEHPETLMSMGNLAWVYWMDGQIENGNKLGLQTLEVRTRVLGTDHPTTLSSIANLTAAYRQQKRWAEATVLEARLMDSCSRVFGDENCDTLNSMQHLAACFWVQDLFEEAEKLQRKELEIRTRLLGAEDPSTLVSMSNLAATHLSQEHWEDFQKLADKILEIHTRTLGPEHVSTLLIREMIATAYSLQGRLTEATELGCQLLELRKKVSGLAHVATLANMTFLASTYRDEGRWADATQLWQQAVELMPRVLGADHRSTLNAMLGLAGVLQAQGRDEESLDMLEQCRDMSVRMLERDQPDSEELLQMLSAWRVSGDGAGGGDGTERPGNDVGDVPADTKRVGGESIVSEYRVEQDASAEELVHTIA